MTRRKARKRDISSTKKVRIKHTMYVCVGGPFDGESLPLSSPNTMIFRVGEYIGRYVGSRDYGHNTLNWENHDAA